MELELDLSVTGATRNLAFASTETEAVFVLLAHLPGMAHPIIWVIFGYRRFLSDDVMQQDWCGRRSRCR